MKPSQLHQTICMQIHSMKPDHLVPGKHIGMEPFDERSVAVTVVPTGTTALVQYNEGPDTYTVAVTRSNGSDPACYTGVHFDQLGELIFGVNAKPTDLPAGCFQIFDEEGNVVEEQWF